MNNTLQALLKTVVVVLAGSIAPVAVSAVDHPTGGTATALANSPVDLAAWGALSYFVHNVYSQFFPTAAPPVSGTPVSGGSAPAATSTTTGK